MIDFNAALVDPTAEDLPPGFGALPPATAPHLSLAPVKAALSIYEPRLAAMESQATGLEVTDATLLQANELGALAAKVLKALDKARKDFVEEPNQYVKSVNNLAKGFAERLEAIKRTCAAKISDYQRAQALERAKAEEAARKAQAEVQARLDAEVAAENAKRKAEAEATGQAVTEVAPIVLALPVVAESPKVVRTEAGSSHQVKAWAFKIVDPALVPREFLMVDESAIRA
jgi:chemotaxis protein histidine kinase CheA